MELIFIFSIVFIKVSFIDFLKVFKIVRAFRINTFVNNEIFPVFFMNKRMVTMRTSKDIYL